LPPNILSSRLVLCLVFFTHSTGSICTGNEALGLEGGAHREADGLFCFVTAEILEVPLRGFVAAAKKRAGHGSRKGCGAGAGHFNRGEEINAEKGGGGGKETDKADEQKEPHGVGDGVDKRPHHTLFVLLGGRRRRGSKRNRIAE
jgi:hypothetical protein